MIGKVTFIIVLNLFVALTFIFTCLNIRKIFINRIVKCNKTKKIKYLGQTLWYVNYVSLFLGAIFSKKKGGKMGTEKLQKKNCVSLKHQLFTTKIKTYCEITYSSSVN